MIRNTYEIEIDGKLRGFRGGTLSIGIACRESGAVTTDEFFDKLSAGDIVCALSLFYGAAYQYAKHNKQPIDFTSSHVSDWLDEIGTEKAREITNILLESFKPKNPRPPETGAQQPSMNGSTSPVLS